MKVSVAPRFTETSFARRQVQGAEGPAAPCWGAGFPAACCARPGPAEALPPPSRGPPCGRGHAAACGTLGASGRTGRHPPSSSVVREQDTAVPGDSWPHRCCSPPNFRKAGRRPAGGVPTGGVPREAPRAAWPPTPGPRRPPPPRVPRWHGARPGPRARAVA